MRGIEDAISALLDLRRRMLIEGTTRAVPGDMVSGWARRELQAIIEALELPKRGPIDPRA